MIISKDLFIFGEQIFATIIPESGNTTTTSAATTTATSALSTPPPTPPLTTATPTPPPPAATSLPPQQQQPAIINTTTTTAAAASTVTASSQVINSPGVAAEQVVVATPPPPSPPLLLLQPPTATAATIPIPTTTLLLTKQETVAVAAAAAAVVASPSSPSSLINNNINTTNNNKNNNHIVTINNNSNNNLHSAGGGGGVGSVIGIKKKSTTKIQKIPKELKTKQTEATTTTTNKVVVVVLDEEEAEAEAEAVVDKVKEEAEAEEKKNFTYNSITERNNNMKLNMNVDLVNDDVDVETMEQVPLVRRNLVTITPTINNNSSSSSNNNTNNSTNSNSNSNNDCRLQIEIDDNLMSSEEGGEGEGEGGGGGGVGDASATSASSSSVVASTSSSSSSSSSSTSSEFTHTSQTTIPSTDNLSSTSTSPSMGTTNNTTTTTNNNNNVNNITNNNNSSSNNSNNLDKRNIILDDDTKSVNSATLTFPFVNISHSQQQQQQMQQQSTATSLSNQQQHSLHHHHQHNNHRQQQHQQQQQQHPTIQLTFQNLNVLHGERKILSDVSGLVSPGEVLAIMGPSGSGKTTLLDCLSGQRCFDSGHIFLNREPLSKKWRRRIGYVLQEEIFFTQLTLRETVMYTALLRLPEKMPRAEKVHLVDHILDTLELRCCQNTKFGDYLNRGLSGGEKKRANIACELLTNPLLMLLDEPTSGLDSHSAISLMKVLKRYAQQEQKTIVISVHQPSSQMFHMFDKLLLLHQGRTAYFGDVHNIYRHFEDIGVTIKPHYNPADFVLEQLKSYPEIREKLFVAAKESHGNFLNRNLNQHQLITSSNCDKSKRQDNLLINDIINNYYNNHHHQYENLHHHHHHASNGRRCEANDDDEEASQHLVWCEAATDSQSNFSSCGSSSNGNSNNIDDPDNHHQWLDYPTRFYTQFHVLSSRNFKEAKPRMLSKLNWFQTIGLALMAGAIWFQLPRTEEFLHDLQGWMFFSQTYWMLFALFGALNSFPAEREVISKERRSGAYRLSAYYLAKMCAELPLIITLPTVYLMISYPMLGCSSLKLFLLMLVFLLLNTIVAQSVGFFIGACCMDMNVSITLSALYTLATQLFGGYLSSRIPDGLSWIRYTSMIHYAYQNMQILEFREGPAITCGVPSSYEICKQHSTEFIPYEEILKAQNSTSPLWLNTLILMMFFLVFRGLGYAVLRYVRCPKKT